MFMLLLYTEHTSKDNSLLQIRDETIEGKIYIRHVQQLIFMLLLYTEHTSTNNSLLQIRDKTIEGNIYSRHEW